MGECNRYASERQARRSREQHITGSAGQESREDASAHAGTRTCGPSCSRKRADQSADAARAHQQAHTEHSATRPFKPRYVDRKDALAHDRKDDPVSAQNTDSTLEQNSGKQTSIAADVADTLGDWGEIDQFTRPERRGFCGVRLMKAHTADEKGGAQER